MTPVTSEEHTLHARPQTGCFVCGEQNPQGLRIHFQRNESGVMVAEWRPGAALEGFAGIVHGGVVSAVLDEAMSKAVHAAGIEALTAELRVRFRRHVESGEQFQVRGWVVSQHKRLIETEAALLAADGAEHAHAWARFLRLPG